MTILDILLAADAASEAAEARAKAEGVEVQMVPLVPVSALPATAPGTVLYVLRASMGRQRGLPDSQHRATAAELRALDAATRAMNAAAELRELGMTQEELEAEAARWL